MIDKLNVPLQEMEKLEAKYGINLHVDQFEDENIPDAYFVIGESKSFTYVGSTLDEVKERLKSWYEH